MTVDYKTDAMFELRKYLWDQFTTIGIFDIEEYYNDATNGYVIPILPVQQQPEMNQFFSGKKHLVYDKIGMTQDLNYLISTEKILFTIYSPDLLDLSEIRNFMTDLFRRMDESASDVNDFPLKSNKFKFHSIYIVDISATSPSMELQGMLAADIVMEIKYSRITGPDGRFA